MKSPIERSISSIQHRDCAVHPVNTWPI